MPVQRKSLNARTRRSHRRSLSPPKLPRTPRRPVRLRNGPGDPNRPRRPRGPSPGPVLGCAPEQLPRVHLAVLTLRHRGPGAGPWVAWRGVDDHRRGLEPRLGAVDHVKRSATDWRAPVHVCMNVGVRSPYAALAAPDRRRPPRGQDSCRRCRRPGGIIIPDSDWQHARDSQGRVSEG